jgi:hypothetical protein
MTRRIAIDWTSDEALLIRALLRDPAHQKAIELIWRKACGVGEMPFVDGDDGRRLTDFNLGRLAVAQSIVPLSLPEVGRLIADHQKTATKPARRRYVKSKTEAKEANHD